MTERTPGLRSLAHELRRLRLAAGLSDEEVIAQAHISKTTLWRAENAEARPTKSTVHQLLTVYDADDATRTEVLETWDQAGKQDLPWLRPYHQGLRRDYRAWIACEAQAARVWVLEPLLVPGLFQTPDYAREVIHVGDAAPADLDAREKTRIERQSVLHKAVNPLPVTAVIDEAALRRVVGNAEIMTAQLEHLHTIAGLRHVTLRVIPFSAGAHPGLPGSSLGIAHFSRRRDRSVVYLDSTAGDVLLDTDDDLDRYTRIFNAAKAKALDPTESQALLTAIHDDYARPETTT